MCKEFMLIIEVDGITHSNEDMAEKGSYQTKSFGRCRVHGITIVGW